MRYGGRTVVRRDNGAAFRLAGRWLCDIGYRRPVVHASLPNAVRLVPGTIGSKSSGDTVMAAKCRDK